MVKSAFSTEQASLTKLKSALKQEESDLKELNKPLKRKRRQSETISSSIDVAFENHVKRARQSLKEIKAQSAKNIEALKKEKAKLSRSGKELRDRLAALDV